MLSKIYIRRKFLVYFLLHKLAAEAEFVQKILKLMRGGGSVLTKPPPQEILSVNKTDNDPIPELKLNSLLTPSACDDLWSPHLGLGLAGLGVVVPSLHGGSVQFRLPLHRLDRSQLQTGRFRGQNPD